jgi:hypothetical protein
VYIHTHTHIHFDFCCKKPVVTTTLQQIIVVFTVCTMILVIQNTKSTNRLKMRQHKQTRVGIPCRCHGLNLGYEKDDRGIVDQLLFVTESGQNLEPNNDLSNGHTWGSYSGLKSRNM